MYYTFAVAIYVKSVTSSASTYDNTVGAAKKSPLLANTCKQSFLTAPMRFMIEKFLAAIV